MTVTNTPGDQEAWSDWLHSDERAEEAADRAQLRRELDAEEGGVIRYGRGMAYLCHACSAIVGAEHDCDPTPCCPDPGCPGNPCTFPGYADNH